MTGEKLVRAEKLISGLGGEKERWERCAEELSNGYFNIVGDVLLSSAIIAYLGPFTVYFRQVISLSLHRPNIKFPTYVSIQDVII